MNKQKFLIYSILRKITDWEQKEYAQQPKDIHASLYSNA